MRDNEKKSYLSNLIEYQPQEFGILKKRGSHHQRKAQTENIYNTGSCQLIKLIVSNPLLLNKRMMRTDFYQPNDSGLLR